MKKNNWLSKLFVILVLLFNYLPIIVVVVYSFNASKYSNWAGFSLQWYEKLFRNSQILRSLSNSLILAFSSCGLSILIGTAGAVGMARSRFRTQGLLENVSMIPMMLPEIILGMAYLAFFSIIRIPFGMLTLIIAVPLITSLGDGTATSGALLAALNYVANTQQTPQVLNAIDLTISVIPCAICVVNAILYRFYPISQKKHKEIMDELIRRRTVTN